MKRILPNSINAAAQKFTADVMDVIDALGFFKVDASHLFNTDFTPAARLAVLDLYFEHATKNEKYFTFFHWITEVTNVKRRSKKPVPPAELEHHFYLLDGGEINYPVMIEHLTSVISGAYNN